MVEPYFRLFLLSRIIYAMGLRDIENEKGIHGAAGGVDPQPVKETSAKAALAPISNRESSDRINRINKISEEPMVATAQGRILLILLILSEDFYRDLVKGSLVCSTFGEQLPV